MRPRRSSWRRRGTPLLPRAGRSPRPRRWGGRGARAPGGASGRSPLGRAASRASWILLAHRRLPRGLSRDKFGAPKTYRSVVNMNAPSVRRCVAVCAVVLLVGPLAAQGVPAPPPPSLTVHTIWGTRDFASDLVSLAWMKDGKAYTTLDDASGSSDLYRVDALTGKKDLLLRAADLVPPGARQPVTIEEYSFSADGSRLLIFTNSARVWRLNTKGTYYVWDFAAKRLIPVSTKPGYQMFAKFSPDGRLVAFVRDDNLYVTDLPSGVETALTGDGGGDGLNGTPGL